jgi:putative sugar O-methyltransferase
MNQQEQVEALRRAFAAAVDLQRKGKLDQAEQQYRLLLNHAASDAGVYTVLASSCFVQGRCDEAMALVERALAIDPSSQIAYAQRDRMRFVLQRRASPAAAAEIASMRTQIASMEKEITRKEIYIPSAFWLDSGALHIQLLEMYGIARFKRTVSHHYQNWVMNRNDAQFNRLVQLWPTHQSAQPYYNSMESPDDVGIHWTMNFPFYDLSEAGRCRDYFIAVGLLFEHTLKNDSFGVLENCEESQIGDPLQLRRKGKLISQDICHSVRERNHILSAIQAKGNEGLVVGELGAGYGRLAEIFGRTTNYRYVIFDVTPALFVSQWYIKQLFPNEKIFEFRTFEHFSEIEAELRESRFAFFTANQIELLPNGYVDIFINVNSLMEMKLEQIKNFLRHIDRVTRQLFFSQQWFKWENTFDKIVVRKEDFTLNSNWKITVEMANEVFPLFFVQIWKKLAAMQ